MKSVNEEVDGLMAKLVGMTEEQVKIFRMTEAGRKKIKDGIPFNELVKGDDYRIRKVPPDHYYNQRRQKYGIGE